MAFKMAGYGYPGKAPKKSPKPQLTKWLTQAKDWLSDKTANISNVVGNDPETRAIHKEEARRQREMLAEQKARHAESARNREIRDDAYWAYKEKHGKGAEHHKAAEKYAEEQVLAKKAQIEAEKQKDSETIDAYAEKHLGVPRGGKQLAEKK